MMPLHEQNEGEEGRRLGGGAATQTKIEDGLGLRLKNRMSREKNVISILFLWARDTQNRCVFGERKPLGLFSGFRRSAHLFHFRWSFRGKNPPRDTPGTQGDLRGGESAVLWPGALRMSIVIWRSRKGTCPRSAPEKGFLISEYGL